MVPTESPAQLAVARPGRAEAAEVSAHEQLDALLPGHLGGLEPIRRRGVEVRPAALPGARRRHSHEIEPQAHGARERLAEQVLDLLPA